MRRIPILKMERQRHYAGDLYKIEDLTGLDFDIEADGRNDYFRRIEGKEHIDVRIDSFADYYAAETTGFKLTDSYLTATISKVTRKKPPLRL